jgi:hypothetical protein
VNKDYWIVLVHGLNFEFDLCGAPNVFRIQHINLLAGHAFCHNVFGFPLRMPLKPVFEFCELVFLRNIELIVLHLGFSNPFLRAARLANNFDCFVNLLGLLNGPFSNVSAAARTLFLPEQALCDALLAEGVAADSGPTRNNEIKANVALQ